jgi:hypothetical protein
MKNARRSMEAARRAGDLNKRMAELQYGKDSRNSSGRLAAAEAADATAD